ncbi:Hypothetical predicted protein [Olea europaea subsp. europaea]|uniref:Uncharacterized protein n=1 Tax=Olea europaea subsp. europaea TaxID=158383 RepID=A0A8S0TPQ2_OLEEU|nr:Hypothetical predicted protein [Olea europaea subsp. europaea]
MQKYFVVGFVSVSVLVNVSHGFSARHQQNSRSSVRTTLSSRMYRDSVAPQFQAERIGTPKEGTSEDETSDEAHDGGGTSGEEEESGADKSREAKGEDLEEHDSGDSDGDRVRRSGQTGTFSTPHVRRATSPIQAPSTSHVRPTATAGSSLTTDDVQGMLLDQRILFEMRLCTVKLEIMQYVSDEFKKLKDFISTIVPASGSTTTACVTDVDPEPKQSDYGGFVGHHPSVDGIDEDMGIDRQEGDGMCINEEHMEPCLDEQDMPLPTRTESLQGIRLLYNCSFVVVEGGHHPSPGDHDKEQDMLPTGTKHLQDTVHIEPCPDNDPMLVLAATDEVQGREVTTKRVIDTTATSGTYYQDFVHEGERKAKTEVTVDKLPNIA